MSFDIKLGRNVSYTLPLKLNTKYKNLVNDQNYILTDALTLDKVTNYTLTSNNSEKYLSDFVCGEQLDNTNVKDKSVPNNKNWRYIVKYNDVYEYVIEKPITYSELTYQTFSNLAGKDVRDKSIKNILVKSIKASRGLVHTSGTTADAWLVYSLPFGGISKATPYFYYVSNNIIKELRESTTVKLDLLEGMVYISQTHPDKIDQVFGYFDIEPLKIFKQDYLTIKGKAEDLFCKVVQKNSFGELIVKEVNEDSFIVSLSYNAFIVSSDPYFVSVDGINLLSPRYVPKNTPILVEQSFNKEKESFQESSITLFNGVESKEISQLTTFIKHDSASNIETFSEKSISSGLFVYKEVEEGSFDITNATYLPLFNPQNIVKEH